MTRAEEQPHENPRPPAVTGPDCVDLACVLPAVGGDPAAAVELAVSTGATAVQPWAFDQHVDAYRTALAASGASAPSGRASVIDAHRPAAVLDAAAELGVTTVVDGCPEATRWSSAEQIARLAGRLNDLAAAARARGLRFAYLTGDIELRSSVHGTHALHVLVRHLDPEVDLAVNVYRASAAGTNAALLLQVLGPRVRLLHLTDGSFDSPAPRQQPLGWGGLNLPRILRAAPQAARVLTYEHPEADAATDVATDVAEALGRSVRWLQDHQTSPTTAPPTRGTP